MTEYNIDWTEHNEHSEDTCYCRCGKVFRSHTKMVMKDELHLVSRMSCPDCGRNDDLMRVSSDPEVMTI